MLMNIGIFVTSLKPASPSQAKLQEAIFSGLIKATSGRYRFIVFSYDRPRIALHGGMLHEPIEQHSRSKELALQWRSCLGRSLLWVWELLGASGGRTWDCLTRLAKFEPKHFQQMRALDIRLLWNMNQHELGVPVPFVRTIWEANHRIMSMYPEYSYARYGFDGCDAGMADSLARASYVITGTEEGKRQLVQMLGVYAGKIHVIPFPVPRLREPASPAKSAESAPYIIYPARFWPHKNHIVIVEALRILKSEYQINLRCIFTGADQGNLAYVLAYAARLGVADLIDYRGEVTEDDLTILYKGALALAYASAVGPDNLPPLEAMTLGCPAVVADVPGAREQYAEAALYFSPTDERALAECLRALLSDNSMRTRQIEFGKARVSGATAETYATSVMKILDEFSVIARAWDRCDSTFV